MAAPSVAAPGVTKMLEHASTLARRAVARMTEENFIMVVDKTFG